MLDVFPVRQVPGIDPTSKLATSLLVAIGIIAQSKALHQRAAQAQIEVIRRSLWLRAGRRSLVLDQCITASEPAYLAKHAFQLAQEFNNFYHKHHILNEEDPARKTFLLATAAVALRELIEVLSWLGIESPEAM